METPVNTPRTSPSPTATVESGTSITAAPMTTPDLSAPTAATPGVNAPDKSLVVPPSEVQTDRVPTEAPPQAQ